MKHDALSWDNTNLTGNSYGHFIPKLHILPSFIVLHFVAQKCIIIQELKADSTTVNISQITIGKTNFDNNASNHMMFTI